VDLSQVTIAPVIVYLLGVTLWLAHYMGLVKSLKERVDKLEKSHEDIGELKLIVAKVETTLENMNKNVERLIQIHDRNLDRVS